MKLSEIAQTAKEIVKRNGRDYPTAIIEALQRKNLRPSQTLRVTRGIQDDLGFKDESLTLLVALAKYLGHEGGVKTALNRTRKKRVWYFRR